MNDQPQKQEPPPGTGGCQPCDLGDLDGLGCKAKRYQKQSEVMTQVAKDLDTYKKQYADARKDFGEAWENAASETELIGEQLEEIRKLLDCRLDPGQKSCLEDAATEVFGELDECAPPPGCCVGECTFDDTVDPDDNAASLGDRIAAYRRDVEAAMACFTSLVGEGKVLTDRIAAIKAEVEALAKDVTGSDASKVARWYARYLVAVRGLELEHIGHGFTAVSDYVDCLCKALQCIAAGWGAIAVLEGARAELTCIEETKKTTCADKQAGVLVAILERYECCYEDKPDPGDSPPTGHAKDESTRPSQTAA
jgi:hypothetical protein